MTITLMLVGMLVLAVLKMRRLPSRSPFVAVW